MDKIQLSPEAHRHLQRMQAAQHAMQTGVLLYTEKAMPSASPELIRQIKHLRVGINTAMCEAGAIEALLIKSGMFDAAEVYGAIADLIEKDVKNLERELEADYGVKITLM